MRDTPPGTPASRDTNTPTEYSIAPSSAFEIATPPTPAQEEGKGKTTQVEKSRQCRQPDNPATGSNLTPIGKTTEGGPSKGKGLAEQVKRYGEKHQNAKRTWENRTNIRRGYNKEGLRIETLQDKDRCEKCGNIHAGNCRPPPDPCKVCGNTHSSKCRYREEDRCEVCRRFHFGECTIGREQFRKKNHPLLPVQTPRPVNPAVPNPLPTKPETGKPRTDSHQPPPPQHPHPQPPPRPLPPANAVPPKAKAQIPQRPTESGNRDKPKKYRFIGTGRNCPAVTATIHSKASWRENYNKILQGTGIHVESVEVDPRLPRERVLTLITKLGETETRATIAKHFIKEQVFEKIFKEKEYPEIVVRNYTVQGGYITSTQIYGVMERLKELNPGLKLGPRYPAFLARRNEPAKTAPLRICLDQEAPTHILVDTPAGGVEQTQCRTYM